MNYELVKELKDAGYPQEHATQWISHGSIEVMNHKIISNEHGPLIAVPTLEELIKECGDIKLRLQKIGNMWVADDKDAVTENYAQTPIEAVARLWLSLNKKS